MTAHAFIDESTRRGEYLICVAVCDDGQLHAARKELKGLLLPGQRRLHFATEGDRRRREILSRISEMVVESAMYTATHRDQPRARAAILERVAMDLAADGATRLTLESREGQDHHDRAVLYRALGPEAAVGYQHSTPSGEPLLWIPDAVAWAFGRGGDWKRRLDQLDLVSRVERVEVP